MLSRLWCERSGWVNRLITVRRVLNVNVYRVEVAFPFCSGRHNFLFSFLANISFCTTPFIIIETMAFLNIIIVGAGIAAPSQPLGLDVTATRLLFTSAQQPAKNSGTPSRSRQTKSNRCLKHLDIDTVTPWLSTMPSY